MPDILNENTAKYFSHHVGCKCPNCGSQKTWSLESAPPHWTGCRECGVLFIHV